MKRYYYKDDNGNIFSFKTKSTDPTLHQIHEEEYARLLKSHHESKNSNQSERLAEIATKKALLNKYREDVEQVDLFDMKRDDYEEKKLLCRQLVLELRELEKNNAN